MLSNVLLHGLSMPGIAHALQVTLCLDISATQALPRHPFFTKAVPNQSSATPFWLLYQKMETYGLAMHHLMLRILRSTTHKSEHLHLAVTFETFIVLLVGIK